MKRFPVDDGDHDAPPAYRTVSIPEPGVTATQALPPPQPSSAPADPYRYALAGCYFQDDPPTERPETLSFQTCADGSQRLESMSWSSCGKAGAQGAGILSFKICDPKCAEDHRVQYAVNVSAFDPTPASYDSGCPRSPIFR